MVSGYHQITSTIRVLLVDDHVMVREGMRCALQVYPGIEVVAEAGDGEEALARVEQIQPSVVVMDIIMPKRDGIEATRLIKTQYPQIAIIGLTRDLKDYTAYAMIKAGAFEVVDKKNAVDELYDVIRRAVTGMDDRTADQPT